MRTLAVLKEGSDINTATLSQRILCSYLDSCSLADRIESLRDHYRKRRDKMEMALRRHFRFPVQWRRPSSGFFFWVESEVFEDTEALLEKTLARGSSFVPRRAFATAQTSPYNTAMRLSFSSCSIGLIDEAVQKVAAACEEMSSRRYFSTHP